MRVKLLQVLGFVALLLLTYLSYSPGLSGPLFFDDMSHLPKLAGVDGVVDSWMEAMRLAFPHHGGTGRSLSYLSLLIDANEWPFYGPGQVREFKHTNLLLHLLNGTFVFWLVRLLFATTPHASLSDDRRTWVALAATALWLLHPLHLSPVMMVIQRMTLLGALFSLLALLAYLYGRRLEPRHQLAAYGLWVFGFGGALFLGLMSKEIALTTTLYMLVLELTVLRGLPLANVRRWRAWAAVFVALPLLLTAGYLLYVWHGTMVDAYAAREFTLGERLLTEARVLTEYLRAALLPSPSQFGPFRDGYVPSRGLFDPPATAFAWAVLVALVAIGVALRKRLPFLSLALLWFVVGHALEAGPIPLELYFEHRNYLPILGFFIAAGYGLASAFRWKPRLVVVSLVAILAFEVVLTYTTAQIWGSHERLSLIWAAERPRSARAQLMAFHEYSRHEDWDALAAQLETALSHLPDHPGYLLHQYVIEHCTPVERDWQQDSMEALRRVVPTANFEPMSGETLLWLADASAGDRCNLNMDELHELIDLYLASPGFTHRPESRANLYLTRAKLCRKERDLRCTANALDAAFAEHPLFEIPIQQSLDFATAQMFGEAWKYAEIAETAPPVSLYQRLYQRERVAELKARLREMEEAYRAAQQAAAGADDAVANPEERHNSAPPTED